MAPAARKAPTLPYKPAPILQPRPPAPQAKPHEALALSIAKHSRRRPRRALPAFMILCFMLFGNSMYVAPKLHKAGNPDTSNDYLIDLYKTHYKRASQSFFSRLDLNEVAKRLPRQKLVAFYAQYTRSALIADRIVAYALQFNAPINFAFATSYVESFQNGRGFNVRAVNINKDKSGRILSIDRGLFMLNSASYPLLKEWQFWDIDTNCRHGVAHLADCYQKTTTAPLALVGYNGGMGRAAEGRVPDDRVDYVNWILDYEAQLDEAFNAFDWGT